MRMWMLDPQTLCRRHLLGEHVELHMLVGSVVRAKKLDGFVARGLLQPEAIARRHDELVKEMRRRGYTHTSPIDADACAQALLVYPAAIREAQVDPQKSRADLLKRCPECRRLFT